MSSEDQKPAKLAQAISVLIIVVVAVLKLFLWRHKRNKAIQLEAELRLLNRYKELLELVLQSGTLETEKNKIVKKLEETKKELKEKQDALDLQLMSLEEEKAEIQAARNWKELLGEKTD